MTAHGEIIIADGSNGWLRFCHPLRVYSAASPAEVMPVLEAVELETAAGYAAAGFITYEAAAGIDAAFSVYPPDDIPLLWFGIYEAPEQLSALPEPTVPFAEPPDFAELPDAAGYEEAIRRIRAYIAAGDTYQVNYTLRLRGCYTGDAYALFRQLQHLQSGRHAAFIDLGERAICSASPELFFEVNGSSVTMRPMKGTCRRGRTVAEDAQLMDALRNSAKDRAENVMIVDMVRNDLGRIAEAGSVRVERLYEIERYPTVLQMTSTVSARSRAGLSGLMRALFPCASITGAPKVRTMEIIREIEESPRGIYTGAIGYWLPERRARFNVAIRTAVLDRRDGSLTYGVGGGIVWDSVDHCELDECLAKAEVVRRRAEKFDLLETIRWSAAGGFWLLERHIERLKDSAEYFMRDFDEDVFRERLALALAGFDGQFARVRCLLDARGVLCIEVFPFVPEDKRRIRRVALVPGAVDSRDRFLYHKTTKREAYDTARNACPECDDVLLMNERGEVTEATIANLVVKIGGELLTPPLDSGLLPGTLRAELLAHGRLREAVITPELLARASEIYLINSLRGWMRAEVERTFGAVTWLRRASPRQASDG